MASTPPPNLLNPLALQIETLPLPYDRGVYTTAEQTLRPGTVVEESPVLVLSKEEWDLGRKTVLDHYCFVWGKTGKMAVALGMGQWIHPLEPTRRARG